MALSILQSPSSVQAAQSPVIFSVSTGDLLYTSSRFQYNCRLDYWQGDYSATPAVTSSYTIVKYPNQAGSGIFDLSKILNSVLQDNLIETTSSLVAYKATFNYIYFTGSIPVNTEGVASSNFLVYDGYNINPEGLNTDWSTKGLYPILIDGPATQSVLITDSGSLGVDAIIPKVFTYSGSNGSNGTFTVSGSIDTTKRIKRIPIGPKQTGFPLSFTALDYFTISSGSISVRYDVVCEPKYTTVRIGFKNRFGQLNYMNFYKASRESFSTTQRTYRPNIGNWNNSTFSTNQYNAQTQKYIVDNEQFLSVNSDYLNEEWNNIIKQMLVSDEIYWFTGNDIIPISISTSNVVFKTGVNDKLIQYSFDFILGRNFKSLV